MRSSAVKRDDYGCWGIGSKRFHLGWLQVKKQPTTGVMFGKSSWVREILTNRIICHRTSGNLLGMVISRMTLWSSGCHWTHPLRFQFTPCFPPIFSHSLLRCITGGADLDQEQLVRGAMEWDSGKLPDEENMESGGICVFFLGRAWG